jgi:hypothetical protein
MANTMSALEGTPIPNWVAGPDEVRAMRAQCAGSARTPLFLAGGPVEGARVAVGSRLAAARGEVVVHPDRASRRSPARDRASDREREGAPIAVGGRVAGREVAVLYGEQPFEEEQEIVVGVPRARIDVRTGSRGGWERRVAGLVDVVLLQRVDQLRDEPAVPQLRERKAISRAARWRLEDLHDVQPGALGKREATLTAGLRPA